MGSDFISCIYQCLKVLVPIGLLEVIVSFYYPWLDSILPYVDLSSEANTARFLMRMGPIGILGGLILFGYPRMDVMISNMDPTLRGNLSDIWMIVVPLGTINGILSWYHFQIGGITFLILFLLTTIAYFPLFASFYDGWRDLVVLGYLRYYGLLVFLPYTLAGSGTLLFLQLMLIN